MIFKKYDKPNVAVIKEEKPKRNIFRAMLPYAVFLLSLSFSTKVFAQNTTREIPKTSVSINASNKEVNGFSKTNNGFALNLNLSDSDSGTGLKLTNLQYSYSKQAKSVKLPSEANATQTDTFEPIEQTLKITKAIEIAGYTFKVSAIGKSIGVKINVTENATGNDLGTLQTENSTSAKFGNTTFSINVSSINVEGLPIDSTAKVRISAIRERSVARDPSIEETIQDISISGYNCRISKFNVKLNLLLSLISRIEKFTGNSGLISSKSDQFVPGIGVSLNSDWINLKLALKSISTSAMLNIYKGNFEFNLDYYKERLGDKLIWDEERTALEILYNLNTQNKLLTQIGVYVANEKYFSSISDNNILIKADASSTPIGMKAIIAIKNTSLQLQVDKAGGRTEGKVILSQKLK